MQLNQNNKPTVWPVVQWWVLVVVIFLVLIVADHFGCIHVVQNGGIE